MKVLIYTRQQKRVVVPYSRDLVLEGLFHLSGGEKDRGLIVVEDGFTMPNRKIHGQCFSVEVGELINLSWNGQKWIPVSTNTDAQLTQENWEMTSFGNLKNVPTE